MYAIIVDNIVRQLVTDEPNIHPDVLMVKVDGLDVKENYIYDPKRKSFSAPSSITITKDNLLKFANEYQTNLITTELFISLSKAKNAQILNVDISTKGRAELSNLVASSNSNPAFTDTWYQSSGNVSLVSSQFIAINDAVTTFTSQTYNILSVVINKINSGDIVTYDGVLLAGWPSKSIVLS